MIQWNKTCRDTPQNYSLINYTYTFDDFINDKAMIYNFTQAIGNEFSNMIYYCYSFAYSFEFVVRSRLSLFSDF